MAAEAEGGRLAVAVDGDGNVHLVLVGKPGATYVIDQSLDNESWSPITTATLPADGFGQWSGVVKVEGEVGHFRARAE
jgi:hypothetical protein